MEISLDVLKQKLAGLEAQEQKLKADLMAVYGAKQLASHLIQEAEKVENAVLGEVQKLEGK